MKKKTITISILTGVIALMAIGALLMGADPGTSVRIASTNTWVYTANGTGAINLEFAPTVDATIVGILVSLEEVGGSLNLTISTDSGTSTTYDFTHDSQDMSSVQWYEWPSNGASVIRLQDADVLDLVYPSPVTTNSYAVKIWWKEI